MGVYLKKFETMSQYNAYTADTENFIKPNVSLITEINVVAYNPKRIIKPYLKFVALGTGTFKFSNELQYSLDDGDTWETLEASTSTPTIENGGSIMFKGNVSPNFYGSGTFSATTSFNAEGNPLSIIYGDDFEGVTSLSGTIYTFKSLFYNCTSIKNAKDLILPATTLTDYCYSQMFSGCTYLETPPELPATTLVHSCYLGMFNGCRALKYAPELPATTLATACYQDMFKNCNWYLTTAPELPATTLANYCYNNMFLGCASLTTAPELPATTLIDSCYFGMFRDCTYLATAPELPATTLANYCYGYMFYGCTRLNYIKAMFTTTPSNNTTREWVSNVASSGTFVKNSLASWNVTGVNGVPNGWTVETASS